MSKTNKDNAIGWLFSQAGSKTKSLVFSVITGLVSAVSGIMPFFIMAEVVCKLIAGEKEIRTYGILCGWMLLFFVLKVVFHSISTKTSHKATFQIIANVRKSCTDKLIRLPLGEVLSIGPGTLKSILVERIDSIETTLAHIVPEFTTNLTLPIILAVAVFMINWKMGIASIITVPIGFMCYMGMMIGYEEWFGNCLRTSKQLNDTTVEYINGIEVIKVFGKAESSYKKFVDDANAAANAPISWMKHCNIFMTVAMCVMPATMITVLPIGGLMFSHGTLSLDSLIKVIIYSIAMVEPIITAFSYMDDLERIGTITGEIRSILDAKDMVRPAKGKVPVLAEKLSETDISLKNVHFSYKEKEVLHGINMEIPSGSFVALVGPSGSGKSTIARLIASLWDADSGSVELNGKNIREIPLEEYSSKIAYVSQDNYLFNQTIRENIRMGAVDHIATDEEVEEVARKSGCYDFIMQTENGFNTVAGSAGGHLSGGERQRIAIARAMLKNAPIVILDEATAYTDPENEAVIQESVAKLVKGKTLIVIAHRLSTVKDADRLFVINNGIVEEEGKHEKLLSENGLYKKMWEAHIASKDE